MSSLESALRHARRPGPFEFCWHWRWELGVLIAAGTLSGLLAASFGLIVLAAAAGAGLAVLGTMLCWPSARGRIVAWAWCVITPHRIRAGCVNAWVQTRSGRLPFVLYTIPAGFGERVRLWCPAGITAADLFAARHILAAACWAAGVRVVPDRRHAHIVTLEVVRNPWCGVPGGGPPGIAGPERTGLTPLGWPYAAHVEGRVPDDPRQPVPPGWRGEPAAGSG